MNRLIIFSFLSLALFAQSGFSASDTEITLTLKDFGGGNRPMSLNTPWRFHPGDDSSWADPTFNDRAWEWHDAMTPLRDLFNGRFSAIGWFRQRIHLNSDLTSRPLYLILAHVGPVEVFWDGQLVYALGTVAATPAAERPVVSFYTEPIRLETGNSQDHVLAVRCSAQQARELWRTGERVGFRAQLLTGRDLSLAAVVGRDYRLIGWMLVAGLSLALMVVHFIIYVLIPRTPENFDFALFAAHILALAVVVLATFILGPLSFAAFAHWSALMRIALLFLPLTCMHFMHSVTEMIRHDHANKILFASVLLGAALFAVLVPMLWIYAAMMVISVELLRALWIAMRKRIERIWILGLGFSGGIVAILINAVVSFGLLPGGPWVEFTSLASLAFVMLSASAYLGSRFARAQQSLEAKIEEGRQAVRALAESEARYRSIAENPIAGVGIVDENNRLTYANDRYLEIIRFRREEVIGQDVRGRIVPEDVDGVNSKLAALYQGEAVPITHEYDIISGDGSRRTMEAGASVYRTRQGKRNLILYLQDVTDARAAERQRREALSLAEETARMASIGVMAGGITHEINQPLNAIMLHAETLQFMAKANRLDQTEPVTVALNHIVMGTERISEIIQHMRSFWVDSPGATLQTVDLNEPVRQAAHMTDQKLHAHAIAFDLKLAANPLPVYADPLQLEQIAINLLTNAANALDRIKQHDKKIVLRTFAENGEAVLEVSDNGPGLPAIDPDKLFDPFFSTGKEKGGTGLGLAIVKMFVDKFHGTVSAENNSSSGATFRIRLPLSETKSDERRTKNAFTDQP
jgi:PAS domain S-box-containing protein